MNSGGYPQVIAHRGASRAETENTLDAFRAAAAMGADAAELDVRLTSDGAPAVHHDAALGDGRLICRTPAAELPGHVPLLPAALDACRGMWVNIEIKNDPAEVDFDPADRAVAVVADLLRDRGESERWLISSFRRETVDAMRSALPEVGTAWLTVAVDDDRLEATAVDLARAGHRALHPWVESLTRRTIEVFHRHGLEVNTWTCDDRERMSQLIDWGIDGICTNVPDVALAVIGR